MLEQKLFLSNALHLTWFNNSLYLNSSNLNIELFNGLFSYEEYKILLLQKYAVAIIYNSNFSEFFLIGCINSKDFTDEILDYILSESSKYFLCLSGIEIYKSFNIEPNATNALNFKENIEKVVEFIKKNRNEKLN